MNNVKFIPAVILAAVAVTGSSALAAGPRNHDAVTFQELDANGDGQVTKQEMQARQSQRFTAADTDGDGKLSAAELQAAGQQKANERVEKMFERHDANGDGFLSDDELPKPRRADKMFDRIDADNDGAISEQEFADAKDKMGRHHKKRNKSGSDDG